jgi:hypothetical protein
MTCAYLCYEWFMQEWNTQFVLLGNVQVPFLLRIDRLNALQEILNTVSSSERCRSSALLF